MIHIPNLNNKIKKASAIFILIIVFTPQIFILIPLESDTSLSSTAQWVYSMRTDFNRTIDLFADFNATAGYRQRQAVYLNDSKLSNSLDAQAVRVYLNLSVNEATIRNSLLRLLGLEHLLDFNLNPLVRIMYLDLNRSVLSSELKDNISDAFGKTFYWYEELNEIDDQIIWTENHQILFHSAELLVGQLYPNDTFTVSGMTGDDHVAHATPLLKRWLDIRGQIGFTEWHSTTYLRFDVAALLNLVDFAMDPEIVYKSAMILDQIAFGFANNFFQEGYATSAGRCYDGDKVAESPSTVDRDSNAEAAWIMLGIGKHVPSNINKAATALATSDHYAPPPVLEAIANDTRAYYEHKERTSIYLDEGPSYNITYTEEDLMFWWSMSAPMAPQVIQQSFDFISNNNVDPWTIMGPPILMDFLEVSAFLHGQTLGEYSESLKLLTEGVALEATNIYTYRTPYYQLSGAQDHQKGMDSMQEHIWQATLDNETWVFTNSPGGITKDFDQEWMGGWMPRATLHKNMGVIQYDRELMPIEGELIIFILNLISDNKFYQHAYFPRWAFDEVRYDDKWVFGRKNDSYIALYSYEPTWWENNYELRVWGYKNCWIVELGSIENYTSFDEFVLAIQQAPLVVTPQTLGYNVRYTSPSQGVVSVAWDGPMSVNGTSVDLGPYPRYDNPYCYQEFGTKQTVIQHGTMRLGLYFNNNSRQYQEG